MSEGDIIMDEMRYQLDLLKAMNQKISDAERMYRLICDTSNNAFLYYSYRTKTLRMLGAWGQFFDFSVKDLKDFDKLYEAVEEKYVVQLKDTLFIEKRRLLSDSMQCCLKNQKIWLEFETDVCYDDTGHPTDKIIRIKDVTKFKIQNDDLAYMAYYDSLTGLYNRNYFVRILGDFVRRAKEENTIVSVMFLDVDDFRRVNDGMGMLVGDELVQQLGQYLKTFSEENVIVCHMSSDIYCIAIYDPCGVRSVEHIHHTIQERVKQGFKLSNGQELDVTISVGVAEYPEAAQNALELINCAEIVMFKAKNYGKDAIQYFDAPILNEFLQSVAIENQLKNAVYNQNFVMYFQPQYYADNKRLRGVEALIRWRDDSGKMISPAVFIPIAEKNGTIIPIGSWVIEESVRNFTEWKRKYGYPMILSINISAIQYKRADFVSQVVNVLKKYDISPSEVELEITESVLIDDLSEVKDKLQLLREYGIKVSLDDFGTGFSSLAYLKGLPIDTLKIDKSFIDNIVEDDSSRIITEAMISMVDKLGFETIAEGVETQEQYEYLKDIGCDVIQGFLLGRPMPAEEIENLLIHLL